MIVGQNSNSKAHEGKIVRTEFLSKLSERIVIIPCAGFGTRVGSPPAKELLKHPNYGMTFLEKALLRVSEVGATPLVISRFDKSVLNEWLFKHEIPHLLVLPTSEWVETVTLTQSFWKKENLLLLPDTDFSPANILADLFSSLEIHPCAIAAFSVSDLSAWGAVKRSGEKFFVAEKIKESVPGLAWGLIAWKAEGGEKFWDTYEVAQMSKKWEELPFQPGILTLEYFEDLTRKTI